MARVFILESPSPYDLLCDTNERSSLERVCRLFGHNTASFFLQDQNDLEKALKYVGAMGWASSEEDALFIHFSSHGTKKGLAFGSDEVGWKRLSKLVLKSYEQLREYDGPIVLILSACHAKSQKLTHHLSKMKKAGEIQFPPEYILVFGDSQIDWRDAVVAWTIFYHKVDQLDWTYKSNGRTKVQQLLTWLWKSELGDLIYFRWDIGKDRYLRWRGKWR